MPKVFVCLEVFIGLCNFFLSIGIYFLYYLSLLLFGKMAGKIGSIEPYNEAEEDFESYCSRIEMFFLANDIANDKKVAAFFTLAGPKVFGLARDLMSPRQPGSSPFTEILDTLKRHYKPKPILIYERFKFYKRQQKAGEPVKDYIASLRALAHTCEFGTTLNEMLRDRFVMGLNNEKIQQTLLAETELNFDRAVSIATARETASKDVQAMTSGSVNYVPGSQSSDKKHNQNFRNKNLGVNKLNNVSFSPKSTKPNNNFNSNSNSNVPNTPCSGCGRLHWKRDCPFKNATCHGCKQKGHIKKMCFRTKSRSPLVKSKSSNNVNFTKHANSLDVAEDSSYDYTYKVADVTRRPDPIVVNVLLNSAKVPMELDTGATCTLIPKSQYNLAWPFVSKRPRLVSSHVTLNAYGGIPLKVEGEIDVSVELENGPKVDSAKVVVVDGEGPCLLGRDLIGRLGLINNIHEVHKNANFCLQQEYPKLFSGGLGCYKGRKFTIEVDQSVSPKFCKARTVPYVLRAKIDEELDRLCKEGIICPITHSPWAAAVVPVLKPNGKIRLCGDYKLTVNRAAKLDTYPIPTLDDLFSGLAGGKIFSKLDMSQAYAQLCLEDESKKYTVINTHRGLFQYNRLSFGISAAPGIFQRAMEGLLRDIPGVFLYLDDILISGATEVEHMGRLRLVLSALQTAGLRLSIEKCTIGVTSVTYLGYRIDKEGLHPTDDKIKAIKEAPVPTNITQLRAFLGLLNFYRRFIPRASTMLEPLNRLLQAKTPWVWGREQAYVFKKCKNTLINSGVLVHFDPKLPLVVVADSSSYGVGAVLCHIIDGVERPICFASRTLMSAERNYSQLEKEALAVVYALRKFHFYLWGQNHFTVVTDHKPLLGIFSSDKNIPPMSSGRIQRWSLLLQAYKFTLRHRSGTLLGTADALSRLPLNCNTDSTPVPAEWIHLVEFLDSSPVTSVDIKEQTRRDPTLSKVMRFCEVGWSTNVPDASLTPYVRRREELSLQDGCVLWGSRVIVPPRLRPKLLEELHGGHAGSSRMKELARSYVWWPNLDSDIEDLSNSCPDCLSVRAMPSRAALHPWEWPTHPWHRLHIDYAGPVNGRYFLVIVDAHSKWVDVYPTSGTTAKETIQCLKQSFSRFGLPVSIVSDNGPCFISQEFKDFCKNINARHITTAVYKPSTNGLAEKMVQTLKKSLHISKSNCQDTLNRFLFNYRLTPHTTTGVSPAELMFGRRLRSKLDLLWPADSVSSRVVKKQNIQRRDHVAAPRTLHLPPDSPVMIRNYTPGGCKWTPSKIVKQSGPLSYRCETPSGAIVKRHQDQIITRTIPSSPTESFEAVANSDSSQEPVIPVAVPPSTPTGVLAPSNGPTLSPGVRRSSRVRRPVVRLDL